MASFFLFTLHTFLLVAITTAFTLHYARPPANFRDFRSHALRLPATTTTSTAATTTLDELDQLLQNKDMDAAISLFQQSDNVSVSSAAKMLSAVAEESASSSDDSAGGPPMVSPVQEQRLLACYQQIKEKVQFESGEGLFGSVDMNSLKLPYQSGCSIEQLETLTQLPLSAFRPNPKFNRLFYLGGAAACILEIAVAKIAGINPQPLFAATFASVLADQVLGGAASEQILWKLNPQLADRVLKHEAGHLLVAHLLGCPVQSVALGNYDALTKRESSSALVGAGTSFFDPKLNEASQKGEITRSVIDRYSIIVMAGIAAEALCFGEAEGGSDDENALAVFLSQTVQTSINIPEQARWAATNALLLLREYQDAYERLVTVLRTDGSRDIGKIMMALEGCDI